MSTEHYNALNEFLDVLGLDEEPIGVLYTDQKPKDCTAPKTMPLPTRKREIAGRFRVNCTVILRMH